MNLLGLSTHVLQMRCQNTQTLSSILPKGMRAESGFIHDSAPRQLPPLCMHVDTCCTGHSQWKTEITRTPSPEQSGCCGEEVAEGPPAYRHTSSLVINTATHKVKLRTKLCLYHHKTRQKIYMYIYIYSCFTECGTVRYVSVYSYIIYVHMSADALSTVTLTWQ